MHALHKHMKKAELQFIYVKPQVFLEIAENHQYLLWYNRHCGWKETDL